MDDWLPRFDADSFSFDGKHTGLTL